MAPAIQSELDVRPHHARYQPTPQRLASEQLNQSVAPDVRGSGGPQRPSHVGVLRRHKLNAAARQRSSSLTSGGSRRRPVCLIAAGAALVLGAVHGVILLQTLGSLSLDPRHPLVTTFLDAALFYKLVVLAPVAVALGALVVTLLNRSLVGDVILWAATSYYVVVFVGGFIALLPPAPVSPDEWTKLPFYAYAGSAFASVIASVAAVSRRSRRVRSSSA